MVSNRLRYVSESTTDDETVDMEYLPNKQVDITTFESLSAKTTTMSDFQQNKPPRKPTRTPKCFSKNALMARENRLKKKMYINSLENQVATLKNDNKKLTHVVDNQSCMIDELKKEVKYLKSILANSESIGKLIRAINSCTGMPVTTSLEKTLTANSIDNMNKSAQITAPETKTVKQEVNMLNNNNFDMIRHPWEEKDSSSPYMDYPTPSESSTSYGSPEFEELNNEGLLLDMDIPIEMNNDELLDLIDEKALESPLIPIEEHNYHNPIKIEQGTTATKDDEDVGVCLHVSKNKVSLEFCPSCSDKALQSWKGGS